MRTSDIKEPGLEIIPPVLGQRKEKFRHFGGFFFTLLLDAEVEIQGVCLASCVSARSPQAESALDGNKKEAKHGFHGGDFLI